MLLIKASIKQSAIHGLGLFAEETILKDTKVWKFSSGLDLEIEVPDGAVYESFRTREYYD